MNSCRDRGRVPRHLLRPRSSSHGSVAATPLCPRPVAVLTAPALSAPAVFLQLRPPPPLLSAAMESSTLALVPVFAQLSNLQSLLPAVGAASFIAICAPHPSCSHVTPGDPGAGAGQDPAPS